MSKKSLAIGIAVTLVTSYVLWGLTSEWGEWSGGAGAMNMDKALIPIAELGFLRRGDREYTVVPEAKARIQRKRVEA